MSITAEQITEERMGDRDGYRLVSDSNRDSTTVNLDIWEDEFNLEWRTSTDLGEFTEMLDNSEYISDDMEATAWFGSADLNTYSVESSYGEIKDHERFPEFCGNIHLYSEGQFEIYWQETKDQYTIEYKLYDEQFDHFTELYSQTVSEPAGDDEELVGKVKQVLKGT